MSYDAELIKKLGANVTELSLKDLFSKAMPEIDPDKQKQLEDKGLRVMIVGAMPVGHITLARMLMGMDLAAIDYGTKIIVMDQEQTPAEVWDRIRQQAPQRDPLDFAKEIEKLTLELKPLPIINEHYGVTGGKGRSSYKHRQKYQPKKFF